MLKEPADIFLLEERYAKGPKAIAERAKGGANRRRPNCFAAVKPGRTIPLDRFILALSIPHVGEVDGEAARPQFPLA